MFINVCSDQQNVDSNVNEDSKEDTQDESKEDIQATVPSETVPLQQK